MTNPEPEPVEPVEVWDGPDETWSFNEAIEWHLARVARHEARLAGWDAETERMIERHREWNARRSEPSKQKAVHSRQAIEQLMLERIAADRRAPLSVELPSGRVTTRKGQTAVHITDLDALLEWAKHNNAGLLRMKAEPRLDEIRTALADGEAVPGVQLVDRPRTVTIRTEANE